MDEETAHTQPIHWIPEKTYWHDLEEACAEAIAYSQAVHGNVRFNFRRNVYEVNYGEDVAQLVGGYLNDDPEIGSPYWHGRRPYLNWSVPPADPLDFPIMPQVPDNIASVEAVRRAAVMLGDENVSRQLEVVRERLIQDARRDMEHLMFRPSPILDRLRASTPQAFESQPFRNPIQYAHLSEVASYPIADEFFTHGMKSAREMELERRLDTVRQVLFGGSPGDPLVGDPLLIHSVNLYQSTYRDGGPATTLRRHVSVEASRQLVQALDYGAAQPTEPYVYRYQFMNANGSVSAMAMAGAEKLERGTILDAAARPIRKFRLVEE